MKVGSAYSATIGKDNTVAIDAVAWYFLPRSKTSTILKKCLFDRADLQASKSENFPYLIIDRILLRTKADLRLSVQLMRHNPNVKNS